MADIVDAMRFVVVVAAAALFLGTLAYLAALVRMLAPAGGLDRMPIPPAGVPERAAAIGERIRAHVRARAALPSEPTPETLEPVRFRLPQRHGVLIRHQSPA
jgi:hypothetical protein